jgi:hypothetical protein
LVTEINSPFISLFITPRTFAEKAPAAAEKAATRRKLASEPANVAASFCSLSLVGWPSPIRVLGERSRQALSRTLGEGGQGGDVEPVPGQEEDGRRRLYDLMMVFIKEKNNSNQFNSYIEASIKEMQKFVLKYFN